MPIAHIPVHAGLAKFLKEHKAWNDKWTVAQGQLTAETGRIRGGKAVRLSATSRLGASRLVSRKSIEDRRRAFRQERLQ